MPHRKVSDILKVQRWEAVRGHSSDLIQKERESQKKTKKGTFCVLRGSSPRLAFTVRQVNLRLKGIKHVLQAAVRLRRPPRCLAAASRVTTQHSRGARRADNQLTQTAVERKRIQWCSL